MGLELMGFAVANADELWIDPFDYRSELRDAVLHLAARGLHTSPSTTISSASCHTSSGPTVAQSISDWKNDYLAAVRSVLRQRSVRRLLHLVAQTARDPARGTHFCQDRVRARLSLVGTREISLHL